MSTAQVFTFGDFLVLLKKVAKEQGNDSMVAGLESIGDQYSLTTDTALDSLTKMETMMAIEEAVEKRLEQKLNLPEKEIEGVNVAGMYQVVCKVAGIEPSA